MVAIKGKLTWIEFLLRRTTKNSDLFRGTLWRLSCRWGAASRWGESNIWSRGLRRVRVTRGHWVSSRRGPLRVPVWQLSWHEGAEEDSDEENRGDEGQLPLVTAHQVELENTHGPAFKRTHQPAGRPVLFNFICFSIIQFNSSHRFLSNDHFLLF